MDGTACYLNLVGRAHPTIPMKMQKILLACVPMFLAVWKLPADDVPSTPSVPATVRLGRGYSNPEMTAPHWSYPIETLCPKYGFKPYYVLFANEFLTKPNASGGWDLDKLLAKISDTTAFPKGAMVAIDLEDEGSHVWDTSTITRASRCRR